jgi:hypothetical protein
MSIDTRALQKVAKEFTALRRALHVGEARAAKRAGTSVRAAQVKEIGRALNVRAGGIRDAIAIKHDAKAASPSVTISAVRKGVALDKFVGTRQTKKGLSVKVLRAGPRSTLSAAFLAKTKGGAAFGRVAQGSKRYGTPHVGRLPIAKLFGPGPGDRLATEPVQQLGAKTWQERVEVELRREEAFALKKMGY